MRVALVLALTLSALFLVSPTIQAQNRPVLCLDTCEPDPTSGSYAATYAVRPQSKNGRAGGSIISRPMTTDSPASALPGSESYSYATPILSLPGRNGLEAGQFVIIRLQPGVPVGEVYGRTALAFTARPREIRPQVEASASAARTYRRSIRDYIKRAEAALSSTIVVKGSKVSTILIVHLSY